MPNNESNSDDSKKVSRRGALKWAGALAAVGIVGVGLGLGGDLLVRPNSTKTSTIETTKTQVSTQTQVATQTATEMETSTATATQTAISTAAGPTVTKSVTSTVAPPPTTISYVAPLSPQVQDRVNSIFQSLEARHSGETTSYYVWNTYTRAGRCSEILKVHLKNGILTAVEPDDTVNPNVAREDLADWNNVVNGTLQLRPHQRWAAYRKMIYDPNRLLYPMQKVGTRGVYNTNYVRVSWDTALTTVANAMSNAINKYGPYSIYNVEQMFTATQWYGTGAGQSGYSIFSFPGHQFACAAAFNVGVPPNAAAASESYGDSSQMQDIFNSK